MRSRRDAKIELMARVPLFAHCSKRELAWIAATADELALPEGRELTHEGSAGHEFVILLQGTAEVRRGGRKLNELGPGDFVGEISLLTGKPRTATVRTTAPTTVLVLTHGGFRELMRHQPTIQGKVLTALADRLAPELV